MSDGSESWKALRQLMERGMPLKEMHLRPTSRMISAVWTGESAEGEVEATSWRTARDSGELSVKVAALCRIVSEGSEAQTGRERGDGGGDVRRGRPRA